MRLHDAPVQARETECAKGSHGRVQPTIKVEWALKRRGIRRKILSALDARVDVRRTQELRRGQEADGAPMTSPKLQWCYLVSSTPGT